MNQFQHIQLLHNPGAGSGSISREEISAIFRSHPWKVTYTSTKENWALDPEADLVVVAGGDGTIRKLAEVVLELPHSPLIAILPMGTANNIATALRVQTDIRQNIEMWVSGNTSVIDFNSGRVNNPAVSDFFIEGAGFGIFPRMISEMKKQEKGNDSSTPDGNIQRSVEAMFDTAADYKPTHCTMNIDGKDFSGDLLLIEIMNIPCVGPNILFAPGADPGDDLFDIVIAGTDDRHRLKRYFKNKLENDTDDSPLPVIHGKNISIMWAGNDFHLDDTLIHLEQNAELTIGLSGKKMKILVPGRVGS